MKTVPRCTLPPGHDARACPASAASPPPRAQKCGSHQPPLMVAGDCHTCFPPILSSDSPGQIKTPIFRLRGRRVLRHYPGSQSLTSSLAGSANLRGWMG
jgi:hypothetical protein